MTISFFFPTGNVATVRLLKREMRNFTSNVSDKSDDCIIQRYCVCIKCMGQEAESEKRLCLFLFQCGNGM